MAYTNAPHGPDNLTDVYIADDVFNSEQFDGVLLHEFIHVVENFCSTAELSPRRRNGCSALAVNLGEGLAELLKNLKQTT